ncbi:MAG TPA: hypothetical protein PLS75_05320, partial [Candidatus Marinimicrobia bacterium]|nr:hypothetical protein [Candidatus Neomarinimicrobiota bacterium]
MKPNSSSIYQKTHLNFKLLLVISLNYNLKRANRTACPTDLVRRALRPAKKRLKPNSSSIYQ